MKVILKTMTNQKGQQTIVRMKHILVMLIRKHQKMRQVNEKKMTNRSERIVRIVVHEKYSSKTCNIINNAKSKSDKYVNNDAEESNRYKSNYCSRDIVEKLPKVSDNTIIRPIREKASCDS